MSTQKCQRNSVNATVSTQKCQRRSANAEVPTQKCQRTGVHDKCQKCQPRNVNSEVPTAKLPMSSMTFDGWLWSLSCIFSSLLRCTTLTMHSPMLRVTVQSPLFSRFVFLMSGFSPLIVLSFVCFAVGRVLCSHLCCTFRLAVWLGTVNVEVPKIIALRIGYRHRFHN